jgi:coenzyme F420-reducing hydrogenase delta subunit
MNRVLPQIVVFACNWNGWSCIEAAADSGLSYSASVKVIRVTCLSRVHAGLILQAYDMGADGVLLLGCEPGKCNFCNDGGIIVGESGKAKSIIELMGMGKDKLVLLQLPPFDGKRFVDRVTKMINKLKPSCKVSPVQVSEGQEMGMGIELIDNQY